MLLPWVPLVAKIARLTSLEHQERKDFWAKCGGDDPRASEPCAQERLKPEDYKLKASLGFLLND